METSRTFDLERARQQIQEALEQAGFDIGPDEPNLVQARRDRGSDSTIVFVDSGGQLRYTRTRQAGPERAQAHKAGAWAFHVTRQISETATVSYQIVNDDAEEFATLLSALDQA